MTEFLPTARNLDGPPFYEKVPQEPGPGIPPMPRPAPPGPEGEKVLRLPKQALGTRAGPVARSTGVVSVYKIDRSRGSATFVTEDGDETVMSADTIESVAMMLSEAGALTRDRRAKLARMFAESVDLVVISEEWEPPMTPREALESIIEEVRDSDDRAKAAGHWLTITTNAILEAGRPDGDE